MPQRRLLVVLAVLGLWSSTSWPAVQPLDYPGSRLIHEAEKQDTWYLLALGSITRSKGEWQPEVTERFRGHLRRESYELPNGHAPGDVHEAYLQKLAPKTRRVLFDCRGRGCGGSNFWANRIFEVKELYGPDENQRYTAVEIQDQGVSAVAAIYSIQRANRRSYMHIDWLDKTQKEAQTSISASDLLQSGQPVNLVFNGGGWNEDVLKSVAALMIKQKDMQLYVVGHAYEGAELDAMRQKATDYARQVSELLQERGVAADRLSVFGLGPLAPGTRSVDRVVLIRH